MLKLARNPEFTHNVTVRVPVDGGHSEQTFKARYRVVPWKELTAHESDPEEQARQVLIGWEGIVDDDENPIPYSDAARDELLSMMFVRLPVLRTYVEAITSAKRGN